MQKNGHIFIYIDHILRHIRLILVVFPHIFSYSTRQKSSRLPKGTSCIEHDGNPRHASQKNAACPHKGIRYRPANKNTRNIHIPSIAMQDISRQTGLEHPYLRGYTNKIYHDNFDIWINAPQPPTSIKAAHQNLYNKRI